MTQIKATQLLPEGLVQAVPVFHYRCLALYHLSQAIRRQRYPAGAAHNILANRFCDKARRVWDPKRNGAWKSCGPTPLQAMTYALHYYAMHN